MSKAYVIGWDVGGAHLKAVALNATGEVLQAVQTPCALWKGLEHLQRAVKTIFNTFTFNTSDAAHMVTMTGELVDFFQNRRSGVIEIATTLQDLLSPNTKNIRFYAANLHYVKYGFVDFEQVSSLSKHIASANWHASASVLAHYAQDALLIDIGSTTTDIIPIVSGMVDIQATTDAERMQSDHLVYTGAIRTPVMALGNKILFKGQETNVAAEYFATMADVYRLTGDLQSEVDMADTADGKGKSIVESATRLARMIGYDMEDKSMQDWKALAIVFKNRQVEQIKTAVLKHLKPKQTMIGTGAGAFLVEFIADRLEHPYLPATKVLPQHVNNNLALDVCFPAYAVANLYLSSLTLNDRQQHYA